MFQDACDETQQKRAFWAHSCEDNYPRMCSRAYRLAGNADDAAEIVQETMLKIFRLLPNPEAIENVVHYLLRAVRNTGVDWLRKKYQVKTVSIDDPNNKEVYTMAAPERNVDLKVETEELRRAMAIELRRLNKRERDVFARFLEGFSCDEIATQLHDDPRVISYELNAIRTKVRYRLSKGSRS
jgi:RNA polymerase sigma-70 factor (ECF subfamily)